MDKSVEKEVKSLRICNQVTQGYNFSIDGRGVGVHSEGGSIRRGNRGGKGLDSP